MKGTLTRFAYLSSCTLGWLEFGPLRLATMERPWLPNPKGLGGMPKLSCIPDGSYRVYPHNSVKFPETYGVANELLGVWPAIVPSANKGWGRSAVLIHKGNKVADVIGCIAIGLAHKTEDDYHYITDSAKALVQLQKFLGRDKHSLVIQPMAGTVKP